MGFPSQDRRGEFVSFLLVFVIVDPINFGIHERLVTRSYMPREYLTKFMCQVIGEPWWTVLA